jgi:predicted short-subunit dehydrogenase-like oxidoreductase (DUF2520 family)
MAIKSVSVIGSGNLATHLVKVLNNHKYLINCIYSRNMQHANTLAEKVNAHPVSDISELKSADLIIICTTDSAIAEISNKITANSLVVHTSGSTPMDVLDRHQNFGVLYPFQTFSKFTELDFSKIPLFIEANNSQNLQILKQLSGTISDKVTELDSENRLKLHLSAVFACNFSNHMYTIAKDILQQANLSFSLLDHLILETATKTVNTGNPARCQTGPAVRGNLNILGQHQDLLADNPLWQKIYTFVSDSIMESEEKSHGTF